MLLYLIFIFFVIFLFWMADRTSSRDSAFILFIAFFFIVMFPGLRGMVGPDTPAYLAIYNSIAESPPFTVRFGTIEPVFYIFTLLHAKLFNSNMGYLFFLSAIQGGLLYQCYRNSDKRFLFILTYMLIFYLEFHFNTLRAGIALLIFISAFQSDGKKEPWILLFVALGVHVSVAVFIPLLMIKYGRRAIVYSFFSVLLMVAAFVSGFDYISSKFMGYSEYLVENEKGISIKTLIYCAMVLSTLLVFKKLSAGYKIAAFIVVSSSLSMSFLPIFYRVYFIALLVYFYFIQHELSLRGNRSLISIVFLLLLGLHSYQSLSAVANLKQVFLDRLQSGEARLSVALDYLYIPYEFYWEKPYVD